MPSSFTPLNRLVKQATGEGTNVWGDILNNGAFELIDFALDGVVTVSASGATTLTTANGATDQARGRILNFTGTATGTLTIPSLSKFYIVRAATANCIVTNGGSSATVVAGSAAIVMTDGATVWLVQNYDFANQRLTRVATPTANTDAATKKYVDDTAFATQAGDYPGIVRGRFLQGTNDASSVQWDVGWERKTADFTAEPGGRYLVDTSAGAVIGTLWTSPAVGDTAEFADAGFSETDLGWAANNFTLNRAGNTIQGKAENLTCNVRGKTFGVAWSGADFELRNVN